MGINGKPGSYGHFLSGLVSDRFQALRPVIKGRDKVLQGVAADHRWLDKALRQVLGAYLRLDPVSATREIRMFV